MSKRFIDTGFLDQKWIRKLSPDKKVFLIYLMLKCDNGGIIELDLDDASFWIGKKIDDLKFLPENYLIPLNGSGKYFMPKFIEWQYKDLSSNKFIVAQARQILDKYNLINTDFTLNLHNIYVNITKDVPNSQEQGIGIGIGKGDLVPEKKENYIVFYENELKNIDDQLYHKFVKWMLGENEINAPFKKCLSLKNQIGYKQFQSLKAIARENNTSIQDKIKVLENRFDHYKPNSLTLTLNVWLKKNFK